MMTGGNYTTIDDSQKVSGSVPVSSSLDLPLSHDLDCVIH